MNTPTPEIQNVKIDDNVSVCTECEYHGVHTLKEKNLPTFLAKKGI